MKTITRSSFALIPVIAFAITIMISNGIAGIVKQRTTVTAGDTQTTYQLNSSYRTLFESLNATSSR